MIGRVKRYTLMSLLSVGLLAILATGGVAGASPVDSCDGNTTTIVGGVGDTVFSDTVALYPGSTLTVGYCPSGVPTNSSWLEPGDGFELNKQPEGPFTYTVTITNGAENITFSEHLTPGNQSSVDEELKITVVNSATSADGVEELRQNETINPQYVAFLTAEKDIDNATDVLDEIRSGEVSKENISRANESLSNLNASRGDLTQARSELLAGIQSARASGDEINVVAAAKLVNNRYDAADTRATMAAEEYTKAVESGTADSRSTVRLSAFGSLGVGVVLGAIGGATVPLIAARRAKEKMRLSRDVGVDLKTAILPALLGLLIGLIGVVILLLRIGIVDLLRVVI